MLLYFLYAIFILGCFVLILTVLLQPGKADAGQLFTSSFSSTAFGPRGTQTLLAKITIGAAAVFMLVALALSLGIGRQRSVMESVPETTNETQTAPAPDASPAGEQPQQPATTTDTPAANPDAGAQPAPNTGASPQGAASPNQ